MSATTTSRVAIRNIMLATDFSAFSDAALRYAAGLARRYDSTLFIVNAVPGVMESLPAGPAQLVAEASEQLAHVAGVELLNGIRHREYVGAGDAAAVLSDFAAQNQIDVIVLGTHGRQGLKRLFLGSVAEEVFRQTKCPVLTVGPHVEQHSSVELRHILYATEFGPASQHALPYALSLAEEHDAQLTILHVISFTQEAPSEIEQQLRDLVPGDVHLKGEPEFLIAIGEAPTVIVEIARRIRADCVVLGVKRPLPMGTHLQAGVAYKVVCEADCPVLTVGMDVET